MEDFGYSLLTLSNVEMEKRSGGGTFQGVGCWGFAAPICNAAVIGGKKRGYISGTRIGSSHSISKGVLFNYLTRLKDTAKYSGVEPWINADTLIAPESEGDVSVIYSTNFIASEDQMDVHKQIVDSWNGDVYIMQAVIIMNLCSLQLEDIDEIAECSIDLSECKLVIKTDGMLSVSEFLDIPN